MRVALSRSINGISINGQEYLLNEDDTIREFNSIDNAKKFIFDNGATEKDFEDGVFNVFDLDRNEVIA